VTSWGSSSGASAPNSTAPARTKKTAGRRSSAPSPATNRPDTNLAAAPRDNLAPINRSYVLEGRINVPLIMPQPFSSVITGSGANDTYGMGLSGADRDSIEQVHNMIMRGDALFGFYKSGDGLAFINDSSGNWMAIFTYRTGDQIISALGPEVSSDNIDQLLITYANQLEEAAEMSDEEKIEFAIEHISGSSGRMSPDEVRTRISLIRDGQMSYIKLQLGQTTQFYFERREGLLGNGLDAYLLIDPDNPDTPLPRGATLYADFMLRVCNKYLFTATSDAKGEKANDLTQAQFVDQVALHEYYGNGVLDRGFLRVITIDTNRVEEVLVQAGLLHKLEDGSGGTYATYLMSGEEIFDRIVDESNENKKGSIRDAILYVRDENDLPSGVEELRNAGLTIVQDPDRFSEGGPNLFSLDIVTDKSDQNDFNFRECSRIVNWAIYGTQDRFVLAGRHNYISFDAYLRLMDPVYGREAMQDVRRIAAETFNMGIVDVDLIGPDPEHELSPEALTAAVSMPAYHADLQSFYDQHGTPNILYRIEKIDGKDEITEIGFTCQETAGSGDLIYVRLWPPYTQTEISRYFPRPGEYRTRMEIAEDFLRPFMSLIAEANPNAAHQLGTLSPKSLQIILGTVIQNESVIGGDLQLSLWGLSGDETLDREISSHMAGDDILSHLGATPAFARVSEEMRPLLLQVVQQSLVKEVVDGVPVFYEADVIESALSRLDEYINRNARINFGSSARDKLALDILKTMIGLGMVSGSRAEEYAESLGGCEEFTVLKEILGLASSDNMSVKELYFLCRNYPLKSLNVSQNIIGFFEVQAAERMAETPALSFLAESILGQSEELADLIDDVDGNAQKFQHSLYIMLDYISRTGTDDEKAVAARLYGVIFEGKGADTLYDTDVSNFLRMINDRARASAFNDFVEDYEMPPAVPSLNLPFLRSLRVVSRGDDFGVFRAQQAKLDHNRPVASGITREVVRTTDMFSRKMFIELVHYDLRRMRAQSTHREFNVTDDSVAGNAPVLDYLNAEHIEGIINEYGSERRVLGESNGTVPRVHVVTRLDIYTAKNMLDYVDENGRRVFEGSSMWRSIIAKVAQGDQEPIRFTEGEIQYLRSERAYTDLEGMLASANGINGGRQINDGDRALCADVFRFLSSPFNHYADMEGLGSEETASLRAFEEHLNHGDFGNGGIIRSEDLYFGYMMETEADFAGFLAARGVDVENVNIPELFKVYKSGCEILMNIALTSAMTVNITPDSRIIADTSIIGGIRRGVDSFSTNVFEAVRGTMGGSHDLRGMGIDVGVMMVAKSMLFPEVSESVYTNLLNYSLLNAVWQSAKGGTIDYNVLADELERIAAFRGVSFTDQVKINAVVAALRSETPPEAAQIQAFFASYGLNEALSSGEGENIVSVFDGNPLTVEEATNLNMSMLAFERLYRRDLEFLSSDRADRAMLTALLAAIRSDPSNSLYADLMQSGFQVAVFSSLDPMKMVSIKEFALMLEEFLRDPDFDGFTNLSPSPMDTVEERMLKQYLALFLQLRPTTAYTSAADLSESSANARGFGDFWKSHFRMGAPWGLYVKYLNYALDGGAANPEGALTWLSVARNPQSATRLTPQEATDFLDRMREDLEQIGYRGLFKCLRHETIVDMINDDQSLVVPGSAVFTGFDVDGDGRNDSIGDAVVHLVLEGPTTGIPIGFHSIEDAREFASLSSDDSGRILQMILDGKIILNPESGGFINLNIFDPEIGLLVQPGSGEDARGGVYGSLRGMGDEEINFTTYINDGSLLSLAVNDNNPVRVVGRLISPYFGVVSPLMDRVHTENTTVYHINEPGEVAYSIIESPQSRPLYARAGSAAWESGKMLISPFPQIFGAEDGSVRSVLHLDGESQLGIWDQKARARGWGSHPLLEAGYEFVTALPKFKIQFGMPMWYNVEVGIPLEIANSPHIWESLPLALVPLFIYPSWALPWHSDVVTKIKEGDVIGALFTLWALNTFTSKRRNIGGMLQPSMWDRSFNTVNRLYRSGRALYGLGEGAIRSGGNGIRGRYEGAIDNARLRWHEVSELDRGVRGATDPIYLSDSAVSRGFRWTIRNVLGGPYLRLENAWDTAASNSSNWAFKRSYNVWEGMFNPVHPINRFLQTRLTLGYRYMDHPLAGEIIPGMHDPLYLKAPRYGVGFVSSPLMNVLHLGRAAVSHIVADPVRGAYRAAKGQPVFTPGSVRDASSTFSRILHNENVDSLKLEILAGQDAVRTLPYDSLDVILSDKTPEDIAEEIANSELETKKYDQIRRYRETRLSSGENVEANLEALRDQVEEMNRNTWAREKEARINEVVQQIREIRERFSALVEEGMEAAREKGIKGRALREYRAQLVTNMRQRLLMPVGNEGYNQYADVIRSYDPAANTSFDPARMRVSDFLLRDSARLGPWIARNALAYGVISEADIAAGPDTVLNTILEKQAMFREGRALGTYPEGLSESDVSFFEQLEKQNSRSRGIIRTVLNDGILRDLRTNKFSFRGITHLLGRMRLDAEGWNSVSGAIRQTLRSVQSGEAAPPRILKPWNRVIDSIRAETETRTTVPSETVAPDTSSKALPASTDDVVAEPVSDARAGEGAASARALPAYDPYDPVFRNAGIEIVINEGAFTAEGLTPDIVYEEIVAPMEGRATHIAFELGVTLDAETRSAINSAVSESTFERAVVRVSSDGNGGVTVKVIELEPNMTLEVRPNGELMLSRKGWFRTRTQEFSSVADLFTRAGRRINTVKLGMGPVLPDSQPLSVRLSVQELTPPAPRVVEVNVANMAANDARAGVGASAEAEPPAARHSSVETVEIEAKPEARPPVRAPRVIPIPAEIEQTAPGAYVNAETGNIHINAEAVENVPITPTETVSSPLRSLARSAWSRGIAGLRGAAPSYARGGGFAFAFAGVHQLTKEGDLNGWEFLREGAMGTLILGTLELASKRAPWAFPAGFGILGGIHGATRNDNRHWNEIGESYRLFSVPSSWIDPIAPPFVSLVIKSIYGDEIPIEFDKGIAWITTYTEGGIGSFYAFNVAAREATLASRIYALSATSPGILGPNGIANKYIAPLLIVHQVSSTIEKFDDLWEDLTSGDRTRTLRAQGQIGWHVTAGWMKQPVAGIYGLAWAVEGTAIDLWNGDGFHPIRNFKNGYHGTIAGLEHTGNSAWYLINEFAGPNSYLQTGMRDLSAHATGDQEQLLDTQVEYTKTLATAPAAETASWGLGILGGAGNWVWQGAWWGDSTISDEMAQHQQEWRHFIYNDVGGAITDRVDVDNGLRAFYMMSNEAGDFYTDGIVEHGLWGFTKRTAGGIGEGTMYLGREAANTTGEFLGRKAWETYDGGRYLAREGYAAARSWVGGLF